VLTDDGPLTRDIPRDRAGTFEPQLIGQHARRFTGFDDKILALDARGMTVREIQAFLVEMDRVAVSPDFISTVTDAVHPEGTGSERPQFPLPPVASVPRKRSSVRPPFLRSSV
jgi:putative transposase